MRNRYSLIPSDAGTMPESMPAPAAIAEFRNTVTPDLYDVRNYINWVGIETRIARCASSITFLQETRDLLNPQLLAQGLRLHPTLYEVACGLLAVPRGAGFADGRELPDPANPVRTN